MLKSKSPVNLAKPSEADTYQEVPATYATIAEAPNCILITLTITSTPSFGPSSEMQERVSLLANALSAVLRAEYALHDSKTMVYTSLYHHAPDAQPKGLPVIVEGQHGKGDWVVCTMIINEEGAPEKDLDFLENSINGSIKKNVDGMVGMSGIEVKVGVWKGDVFMS